MNWTLAVDDGAASLITAIRDAGTGKTRVHSSPGANHAGAIRRAVDRGMEARGRAPSRILLAHPASADGDELRDIADAADDDVRAILRFVPEPVAAAHHCLVVAPGTLDERLIIADAGARGFRVSVLVRIATTYSIDVHRRSHRLGGHALDSRVREWANAKLAADYPRQLEWLSGEPTARAEFSDQITAAKRRLSELESTHIEVPGPYGPMPLLLTRTEFDALIRDDVDMMAAEITAVMGDAAVSDSTPVHLVGGGAHIPALHERLARSFDVHVPDEPETVVARGALSAVGARPPAPPAPPAPPDPPHPTPQPAPAQAPSHDTIHDIATRAARKERRRSKAVMGAISGLVAIALGAALWASGSFGGSDDADRVTESGPDSRADAETGNTDPRERERLDMQREARSTLESGELPEGSPLDPAACEDSDDGPEIVCEVPGIPGAVRVEKVRPVTPLTPGHTVLSAADPRATIDDNGGGQLLHITTSGLLRLTAGPFPDADAAVDAYETLGFTAE